MKNYYSNIQYIKLDGVGHFIMMEEVGRFNEAVEGFVCGGGKLAELAQRTIVYAFYQIALYETFL